MDRNGLSEQERRILELGLFDFKDPTGCDMSARCEPFRRWVDEASAEGYFQFLRHHVDGPFEAAQVVGWGGQTYSGINLGSQDYLGLSRHPAVVRASADATLAMGTHSAGSEPMGGGLLQAKGLERQLAAFLGHEHIVLFPTGWAAGYGAIRSIVRPYDHVVMDALSHNCLQHGAYASTDNVSLFAHNDLASLGKRLSKIRRASPDAAVLVITETLFSMDSDHPDLVELVRICKEFNASIMIDIAHDLGVLGPGGGGLLKEAGVANDVDFLVGSFSKTFASIGGFFASREKAPTYYARGYSGSYTFSNYLVPGQVAAISAAMEIVGSHEGDGLRAATLRNAEILRNALIERGLRVLGRVSPMVLPVIGPEPMARIAYRECLERGLILNNIEFPACRRGEARFRMQVSPRHEPTKLLEAADILATSLEAAKMRLM